jgi:queuine tRNA-ribosyltransferase
VSLAFSITARDGAARAGRMRLRHATVDTPAFMPVGTYATVKAMTPEELAGLGARLIVANTFHLMLRPGAAQVAALGGLHRFMGWPHGILTDSGGFQVFSLGALRRISEAGVEFRSPIDGATVFLDPERSMAVQRALGSDIVMVFDECTPYPASEAQALASLALGGALARGPRRQPGGVVRDRAGRGPPAPARSLARGVAGAGFRRLRAGRPRGGRAGERPPRGAGSHGRAAARG